MKRIIILILIILFLIFLIYNNIFKINKLSLKLNDFISKISTSLKSIFTLEKLLSKKINELVYVIDAIFRGTIVVNIEGSNYKVRYIGIDASEIDNYKNIKDSLRYKAFKRRISFGKKVRTLECRNQILYLSKLV